jgi:hypothetical protein
VIKWLVGGVMSSALCCGGFWWAGNQSVKASQEAYAFVDVAVLPVIQTWDIAKLKEIAHPTFVEQNSDAVLKKNFAAMKAKLGNGKSITNWKNKGFEQKSINAMKTTIVCIQGDGTFEKGNEKVTVWMTRDQNKWLLTGFFIGEPPKKPDSK